jgi:cytochrome c
VLVTLQPKKYRVTQRTRQAAADTAACSSECKGFVGARRSASRWRQCIPLYWVFALPTLMIAGCTGELPFASPAQTLEARRGADALQRHGCGACHLIPGVAGADGVVGPPLDQLAERVYLAGLLANSRENLVRWIREPERIDPRTAMPNVGVSATEADDMAAYLLRKP